MTSFSAALLRLASAQAFKRVSKGMGQLADEAESFSSKTILGLLRAAPDLLSHIEHVESMFQPPSGEKGTDF
jgi:DNA mismatch repair protein MSH6